MQLRKVFKLKAEIGRPCSSSVPSEHSTILVNNKVKDDFPEPVFPIKAIFWQGLILFEMSST